MYTQILSKNELVINAEAEKGEGRKKKRKKKQQQQKQQQQHTNGHGKHGEKKGKTGSTTIELPTNTPALSRKQKRGKKSMKTTERKVKAER